MEMEGHCFQRRNVCRLMITLAAYGNQIMMATDAVNTYTERY